MSVLTKLNEWKQLQMDNSKTVEEQEKIIRMYKERRSLILGLSPSTKSKQLKVKSLSKHTIKVKGLFKHTNQFGYVMIKVNQKWVLEHRHVYEQVYGPIPEGWIIHHIDGRRDNNPPENLIALPRSKHSTTYLMKMKTDRIIELEEQVNQLDDIITELIGLVGKNED